jgi:urease accessory protein
MLRPAMQSAPRAGWTARLDTAFAAHDGRTVPLRRAHEGPLRLQRLLYPEGANVCHAIVVHPPGGVASGDELDITVVAERGAHTLLTTPGATKWYRSAGAIACQHVRLTARSGAAIEWLPQESIVFDGATASWTINAEADEGATIIGFDIVMLGRAARGEKFARGELSMRTRLSRGGAPAFVEQWRLAGGDPRLSGPQGLGFAPCFGTLWVIGDTERLTVALEPTRETLSGEAAATLLPSGVLLVRVLGAGPEAVRRTLEAAWCALRPLVLGIGAHRPRIWNT